MIDTHTHIYLEEFDEDRVEVVRRAREAGVERVILPNVDFDTVQAMHATNDLFPGYCRAYIARNRCSVFGSRALSRQAERTFVFALYGKANSRNSGYYDCRGGGGYHGQCCAIVRRRVIPG